MKKSKGLKPLLFENHKKPTSRRDFLASGLTSMAAYSFLPSLFTAIPYKAFGAGECEGGAGENKLIPFLVFDMAGGGGLPANFLVGRQGGAKDLLSSYDLLGWDPRASGIDERFGAPMAPA
ncbi:MAG: hypothetical protein ABL958_09630, partial [Bdellovibrionia bacterium]